jgi:hypothetical protein
MKTNKNLKVTKKGSDLSKNDADGPKIKHLGKDKSSKRRLSIYDDFADEDDDLQNFNFNSEDDYFDE